MVLRLLGNRRHETRWPVPFPGDIAPPSVLPLDPKFIADHESREHLAIARDVPRMMGSFSGH